MKFFEILNEELGPLANLQAGDLINVFKQRGGRQADNKFPKMWGGSMGQNSEQIDIGEIKSWKDVRKVVGRGNEKQVIGAVFYADGKAFAALNLESAGVNMYAATTDVTFAFDPTKLPEYNPPEPPETMNQWDKNKFVGQHALPDTTAGASRHRWDKETDLRKFIGAQMELRRLEKYIDEVIPKFPGHKFTCTVITIDRQGAEKSKERVAARNSAEDELAKRQEELTSQWGSDKRKSLKSKLDAYKASKNFNTFEEPEEVLEFVSDVGNYGQNFVYKGKQYQFNAKGGYDTDIKITKELLVTGKPFQFEVTYRNTDPSGYGYVSVTYRFENGQIKPVQVK